MRLGVNIDHVATLRQARRGAWPDPIEAARACERAGAASIVCHLREDRRHIQDADVRRLKQVVARLNLEMSIARSVVDVALAIQPAQVTLVPERRQELTTEGGLDVRKTSGRLMRLLRRFDDQGIAVSLFIDPVQEQLQAAADVGAKIVELHTGRYANAHNAKQRARELAFLHSTARHAKEKLGLRVALGHGLDYRNASAVAKIPGVEELNIGFSIIARALSVGLERAVKDMIALIQRPSPHARRAT